LVFVSNDVAGGFIMGGPRVGFLNLSGAWRFVFSGLVGLLGLWFWHFCVGFRGGDLHLLSSFLCGEKTNDDHSKIQVVARCESCAAKSCGIPNVWVLLLWRRLDLASIRRSAGGAAH
jgi:hypothetical protein